MFDGSSSRESSSAKSARNARRQQAAFLDGLHLVRASVQNQGHPDEAEQLRTSSICCPSMMFAARPGCWATARSLNLIDRAACPG